MQAGTQAKQLISHRQQILPTIALVKVFFFFSQDSKEMSSLIFVSVIKKVYQENIPFMKQIHIMYVFIKGIIWKTNCYWHMYFFFDLYNVGKYKKKNNFEHVLYPQFIKSEEKKII